MAIVLTALGAGIIISALIDIFQTLFHPAGRGAISDWTARVIWKFFRCMSDRQPRVLTFAGPAAILAIILSWIAFILFGFALLYLPHLGSGFSYDPSSPAGARHGIVGALNLSVGALITLTDGMNAKQPYLQTLRGVEAMLGFGLLTASVSWLLSIYPVLQLRRSIAQRATLLHHAETQNGIDLVHDSPEQAPEWLFAFGYDLSSLRNQMAQFPITFYFYVGEPETSLTGALPYLAQLADRADRERSPALRLAATVLGGAVRSFLEVTASIFLRISTRDPQEMMRALVAEHRAEPMRIDTLPVRQSW